MVDLDTIWLSDPSSDSRIVEAVRLAAGHVFGSMRASSSWIAGPLSQEMYWQKFFLKTPGEQTYLATPFRIPANSIFLEKFLEQFEMNVLKSASLPKMLYNSNMTTFRNLVFELALRGGVVDSEVFSPFDHALKNKVIDGSDVDVHFSSSVGVNNYWQSSRAKCEVSTLMVEHGSSWDKLLQAAIVTKLRPTKLQSFRLRQIKVQSFALT